MAGTDDEREIEQLLLLRMLEGYDDPHALDVPAGFDFFEAKGRFLALAQAVSTVVGEACDVEVWPALRDATFHGSVQLPPGALARPEPVSIRVSNFGNLASLVGDESAVRPELLPSLRRAIERRGYRYVPPDLLARRYTGVHQSKGLFVNWGARFFGYV